MSPSSKASSTVGSSSSTPMKQLSLSFTSKRTTATGGKEAVKGKRIASRKSSTVPGTPQPTTPTPVEIHTEEDADTNEEAKRAYSDDSETLREKEEGPAKRRKLATTITSQPATKARLGDRGRAVFKSREGIENVKGRELDPTDDVGEQPQLAELETSRRLLKSYGEARSKMGNLGPIHAKDLRPVHHILRIFDLADEYGPCIGVSRLQRWERAAALGLNPPLVVKEILTTKEGAEMNEFKECVFYDEV